MSASLAALDDTELRTALLGSGSGVREGWGSSQPAEIAGTPVFVKRIPLTERERAHMFSTRNWFQLPTYYNYGVGSAGFGAFRELASHLKTTGWVLDGAFDSFPLLYHARVTERPSPTADDRFKLEDYVRRWNNSKAVANYMQARAAARHEVWLVLEHFPYTLADWLPANQGSVHRVIDQLCRTIDFLRSQAVVHFDAQPWNVVSDGEQLFLTDFGLVLDSDFELTERERSFLARHSHYDYGEAIASIGSLVLVMIRTLKPDERARFEHRYRLEPGAAPHRLLGALLERLEEVHENGDLPLEAAFVEALTHHREVIVFMSAFLSELQQSPRKNAAYDDAALRRLLDAAGVVR